MDERDEKGELCINDNMDVHVLIEILKRLDDRSLGVAACVCRLWCALIRNDSLWEHVCFGHLSPRQPAQGVRRVVAALGGYRRLYTMCVKPVLKRLGKLRVGGGAEAELSLSLFCVDYYERVLLGGRNGGADSASLMFLCNVVNV